MVGDRWPIDYREAMLVRLFLILALVLSTLPAPAQAAPACHDAPMAAEMTHGADMPAPRSDSPRKMTDALCVGCIAPATLRGATVVAPARVALVHGAPLPSAGLLSAGWQPEPPPPRG